MTDKRIYNLADPTDFEAFALTYGRATAKAFRFQLAYCVRFTGKGFAKASSVDKLAGLGMAELEKRVTLLPPVQRPTQWVHTEYHGGVPRMYRSAWGDANPNPYYGYQFPHIRLMVLADNAITETFVPYAAHCFNHAVDGGIVFG